MHKRGCLRLLLAMVLFCGWSGLAFGQEKFPSRPVNVIIPWAPGAGSTLNAQALQVNFEKAIKQSMVIVNKPGGAGTIAWNYIANSPPDGYTVGVINPSLVVTRYTTKTGVGNDRFDPVIYTVGVPAAVVVRADSPWKTFKEFVAYAKANPGKVNMANSGHAAMYHIGIIGIEMATGAKFTHIPYKGSGPCITSMLGGHADGSLIEISPLIPYVEAKRFRILAVSSAKRSFALPDVPTFKENGFDLDVGTWFGFVVPKGTGRERIKAIHDAFKTSMESKEYREYHRKNGGMVEYMGPEGLTDYLQKQDKLWKQIIDFAGFKPTD